MMTTAKRPLAKARAAKQDEFYTQYIDIQKEIEACVEFDRDSFRDKPVLFIAPCSAVGFWRFRGRGRPLSGALSRNC
jgi:hypothetical protein